jgi:hypothetical protein
MLRAILVSLTLLALSLPAEAQGSSGPPSWAPDTAPVPTDREKALKQLRKACRSELGIFCNGSKKDDEATALCLAKHHDEVTKDCRRALAAAEPYLTSKTGIHEKKAASSGGIP